MASIEQMDEWYEQGRKDRLEGNGNAHGQNDLLEVVAAAATCGLTLLLPDDPDYDELVDAYTAGYEGVDDDEIAAYRKERGYEQDEEGGESSVGPEDEQDEREEEEGDSDGGGGSSYSSSSSSSDSSSRSGSGGGYGDYSSSSSSSDSGLWGLAAIILVGFVGYTLFGSGIFWNHGTGSSPTDPVSSVAYVEPAKLHMRSGPGKNFSSLMLLERGDQVQCLERQTNDGTTWVHVRVGSSDGWVSEKFLTTSGPTEVSSAPPNAVLLGRAGSMPFYANVSRVAFFEAAGDAREAGSRGFETRFDSETARYIYWQIDLSYAAPGQRVMLPLKAVILGSGGRVVSRQTGNLDIQPDWTSSSFNMGWGSPSAGVWTPGKYRVEISSQDRHVASGSFEVYGNVTEVPASPLPAVRAPYVAPSIAEPAHDQRPVLRRPQRVSGGVLAGMAIRKPQPVYPQAARMAGVEGTVVVEVTIDEQGHVIAAHAVSGPPMLLDASVQAAGRWEFTPTLLSGVPVQVTGTIQFNFRRN